MLKDKNVLPSLVHWYSSMGIYQSLLIYLLHIYQSRFKRYLFLRKKTIPTF